MDQWVTGFVSGANAFTNDDILMGTDGYALMAWMDEYCKTHPLEAIGSAAAKLVMTLAAKAPKRPE